MAYSTACYQDQRRVDFYMCTSKAGYSAGYYNPVTWEKSLATVTGFFLLRCFDFRKAEEPEKSKKGKAKTSADFRGRI
jgi:hypothetical protein